MSIYSKLSPFGALDTLRRIPHVSNPSEETKAAYAAAHGYKPTRYTDAPAPGCTATWQDNGTEIVQVWQEPTLEEAREHALQQVQQWRNRLMNTTCTLETPLGWPLEYTPEAVSLAQGTLTLMLTGLCDSTSWTDACNTRHEDIHLEGMKLIAAALASHIRGIQDKADALRARITTADKDGLALVLQELAK